MIAPVSKLDETHDLFPEKFILATEACAGSIPFLEPKVDLGGWNRGQWYSVDILNVGRTSFVHHFNSLFSIQIVDCELPVTKT